MKWPESQPQLATARLLLRPFEDTDADRIEELAGDRDIAATTLTIPHPYPKGVAAAWLANRPALWTERKEIHFAITRDGLLIGTIGVMLNPEHRRAEIGYWIGKPYWGHGYASEAAARVIDFAFEELDLERIYAFHFDNNPASGRVLERAGMTYEGTLRKHLWKWDEPRDVVAFAILRDDWARRRISPRTSEV